MKQNNIVSRRREQSRKRKTIAVVKVAHARNLILARECSRAKLLEQSLMVVVFVVTNQRRHVFASRNRTQKAGYFDSAKNTSLNFCSKSQLKKIIIYRTSQRYN